MSLPFGFLKRLYKGIWLSKDFYCTVIPILILVQKPRECVSVFLHICGHINIDNSQYETKLISLF